jgi:2-polyprenyl-6-methoxyphenol hydroxylase-like FAD-dependent oxidoreductase
VSQLDALVVGGGPAGCAAAMLLARWKHRVALVTKPAGETAPLGESIPPSTRKLFDLLGVSSQIDAAGFVRATGNTVWWGSSSPRVEYFHDGACGWQVTTTALERVLRDAAADSGVVMKTGRVGADAPGAADATFVLDCSGRAGVFARSRKLRVRAAMPATIAIVGLWQATAFDVQDPTHTIIESYDGGWTWSVPRSMSERFVAVMVDPRVSGLARQTASREVYLAELGKTAHLRRILRNASLVDGPRGWDASMYSATHYAADALLLVGDAGSFIDPLSSAGIKKALASGWLAAVATHTALIKPAMQKLAFDFFNAREAEVFAAFRRLTETHWRDAASGHTQGFWADRGGEVDAPVGNAEVAAAFEQLRTAPELHVERHPEAAVEQQPAVSGAEIIMEHRLVRPDRRDGVRFVCDVDLLALVELAPQHRSVPELFSAYNCRCGPADMPAFLSALATAIGQRWLLWCGRR